MAERCKAPGASCPDRYGFGSWLGFLELLPHCSKAAIYRCKPLRQARLSRRGLLIKRWTKWLRCCRGSTSRKPARDGLCVRPGTTPQTFARSFARLRSQIPIATTDDTAANFVIGFASRIWTGRVDLRSTDYRIKHLLPYPQLQVPAERQHRA